MDWVQVVSALGFPIAMCGALCFYIYKVQQPLTGAILKLIDRADRLLDQEETKNSQSAKSRGKEGLK
jgi:hypothetical protein